MNALEAILFDLGETIWHELVFDPAEGAARLFKTARNPRNAALQDVLAFVSRLQAELPAWREACLLELSARALLRLIADRFGLAYPLPPALSELEFWRGATRKEPEPGVAESLDGLLELGLPLGIVSNSIFSGGVLSAGLVELGLADRFQFVMSSADYGLRKPHPLLFQTAVARLGRDPARTWFVGDSLTHDVAGAQAAGLQGVWYNRIDAEGGDVEPDAEVRGWQELLELVRACVEPPKEPAQR